MNDKADRAPSGLRDGLVSGFLLAAASLAAEGWVRGNLPVNLVAQFVLPLYLCYRLTRDWLAVMTLLTINDICMNGASTFFEEAGFPGGRAYLFAATMALLLVRFLTSPRSPRSAGSEKTSFSDAVIWFYALILPAVLVFYSTVACGTGMGKAAWDIHFIAPILLYFPIRRLLRQHEGLFMGWMLSLAIVLSLYALTISLAPLDLSSRIYANMGGDAELFATDNLLMEYQGYTTRRGAWITFIITYIGFFFGLFTSVDFTKGSWHRLLGAALCMLCIGHLMVDSLRGPLLAVLGILFLTIAALALRYPARRLVPRLLVLIVVVAAIGMAIMVRLNPPSLKRFISDPQKGPTYLGDARQETANAMIAAFRERPLMGHGLGVPPPAYRLFSGGGALNFEMQYHLALYRLGLVGFLLYMIPLLRLYGELFHGRGVLVGTSVFSFQGKFRLALLLSVLTTTIAAATNPYLKTGYLMVIIASYWAYTHHLHSHRPVLQGATSMSGL